MAKKTRLSAPPAWQLEFVRLIAFPTSPPVFIDQKWWKELAGDQPEDYVSTSKKESRDERGSFQGVLLSITVDLTRIIWEVRPLEVLDLSGNYATLAGPFQSRFDWFVDLMHPWLVDSCPSLLRLAFHAKLLQPAVNAKEAYRILSSYLSIVNLDSNPNDFLLQINRRKEKSDVVDDLPINRVSTWSKMNVAVLPTPGSQFQWPDRCYSALELDINTAPEMAKVLPQSSLSLLFKELESIGSDIAVHGDQP